MIYRQYKEHIEEGEFFSLRYRYFHGQVVDAGADGNFPYLGQAGFQLVLGFGGAQDLALHPAPLPGERLQSRPTDGLQASR